MVLPTNIDASYADAGDPSRALHQQHHDTIHAAVNGIGVSVRSYAGAATVVPTATFTTLALSQESFDTSGMHDLAINNSRITVPADFAGKWLVVGAIAYPANATGRRQANLVVNGTDYIATGQCVAPAAGSAPVQAVAVVNLAAGSYIELVAYQDSGGDLSPDPGEYLTWLSAAFLGA